MSLPHLIEPFRLSNRVAAAVGGLVVAFATQVNAQSYPSKPIHVIVPFVPGGAADSIARQVSRSMAQRLDQAFIVDNRPGADSALGANDVARSPADGYTLLFTTDATLVLNPLLFKSLSYKPARDFEPIATVAYVNLALVVGKQPSVNNFKELIAYTKANSGKISYGSPGVGSEGQLMGEMYKRLTKTDIVHVPYKGVGPALIDVLGGRIVFTFPSISTIQGYLKDQRIKALAISGESRSPLLPDVPTFTEVGFKEMDIGAWYAFLAPAGTPKKIVAKLNATVNEILSDPAFEKDFINRGMLVMKRTPEQFAAFMRSESSRMALIVKESGARVD